MRPPTSWSRFSGLEPNTTFARAATATRAAAQRGGAATRRQALRHLYLAKQADADDAVSHVGYREILDEAGKALAPGSQATLFVWSLCSGITHGDFWTTINAAERVELPGAPAGMVSLKITADVGKLRFVTAVAIHMTMLGWRLYDERSRAPY
jgi:hypothetical protein